MSKTAIVMINIRISYYFCRQITTDKKQADKQASHNPLQPQQARETFYLVN